MSLKLGSHVSFSKKGDYLVGAVKEALSYKATALMIYLGPPQSTTRVAKENLFLKEYEKQYQKLIPKANILVHAPYIVNPANPTKAKFAVAFLTKEIKTMEYLGLKQIVLHPGAATSFPRQEAIATLITSLKAILKATSGVEIHLELMAGKGTEIGTSLEELKAIIDKVNSDRLGICFDTCHAWDAGYNVNDFDSIIKILKKSNTLHLVRSLHINNSLNQIGAHKDRHANIDSGHISYLALKKIVYAKEFKNLLKILETPYIDKKSPYKAEIALLKKL